MREVGRSPSVSGRSSRAALRRRKRSRPSPSASRHGARCCSPFFSRAKPARADNRYLHMNTSRGAALAHGLVRLCVAAGLALLLVTPTLADDTAPTVYVLPTSGVVDQVMSGYIHDGIDKAQREGAAAALIELNTPGGDLSATRDIVTSLLNAPIPVIVWVGPQGARAASAGTFITLAANVATMAPGTNIGAATPIDSSGQNIGSDLQAKVKQDTLALLRSISDARGRNYDQAATTVNNAASFTATEAVAAGLVNGIADPRPT